MESHFSSSRMSLWSYPCDNLETFTLIWLDLTKNKAHENIEIQNQLRHSVNYLKIFEQVHECEQFIRSTHDDDRLILLIHEKHVQDFIPRIHDFRQLTAIYIIDSENEKNHQWIEQYKKV